MINGKRFWSEHQHNDLSDVLGWGLLGDNLLSCGLKCSKSNGSSQSGLEPPTPWSNLHGNFMVPLKKLGTEQQ